MGALFTLICVAIALAPLLRHQPLRVWALALAGVFFALSVFRPVWLTPLRDAWMGLGALMHRAVSPLIFALLFALAVIPVGLLMRLVRRDPLRLRWDPAAETYWIPRDPPGPEPASLYHQF